MTHPLQRRIETLKARLKQRQARTAKYAENIKTYDTYIRNKKYSDGSDAPQLPNQSVGLAYNWAADGLNITLGQSPEAHGFGVRHFTDTQIITNNIPLEDKENDEPGLNKKIYEQNKSKIEEFRSNYLLGVLKGYHDFDKLNSKNIIALGIVGYDFSSYFDFFGLELNVLDKHGNQKKAVSENKETLTKFGGEESYNINRHTIKISGNQPVHQVTHIPVRNTMSEDMNYSSKMVKILFDIMQQNLADPNQGIAIRCKHGKDRTGSVWFGMKAAMTVLYPAWAKHHFPEINQDYYLQDDNMNALYQALYDARRFDRPNLFTDGYTWFNNSDKYSNNLIELEIQRCEQKLKNFESKVVALDEKQLNEFVSSTQGKATDEKLKLISSELNKMFQSDNTIDPTVWTKFKAVIAENVSEALETKSNDKTRFDTIHQIVQLSELLSHEMTENAAEAVLVDKQGRRLLEVVSARLLDIKYAERAQQLANILKSTSDATAVENKGTDAVTQKQYTMHALKRTMQDSMYYLTFALDRIQCRIAQCEQAEQKGEAEYLKHKASTIVKNEIELMKQYELCCEKFKDSLDQESNEVWVALRKQHDAMASKSLSSDDLGNEIVKLYDQVNQAVTCAKDQSEIANLFILLDSKIKTAIQLKNPQLNSLIGWVYNDQYLNQDFFINLWKTIKIVDDLKKGAADISETILIGSELGCSALVFVKNAILYAQHEQVKNPIVLKLFTDILTQVENYLQKLAKFIKENGYEEDISVRGLSSYFDQLGRPKARSMELGDLVDLHLEDITAFRQKVGISVAPVVQEASAPTQNAQPQLLSAENRLFASVPGNPAADKKDEPTAENTNKP